MEFLPFLKWLRARWPGRKLYLICDRQWGEWSRAGQVIRKKVLAALIVAVENAGH